MLFSFDFFLFLLFLFTNLFIFFGATSAIIKNSGICPRKREREQTGADSCVGSCFQLLLLADVAAATVAIAAAAAAAAAPLRSPYACATAAQVRWLSH